MKLQPIFFTAALFCLGMGTPPQSQPGLKTGDLVFQDSYSRQSEAVRAATHSKFSHVGILWIRSGEPWVYEAVQPVSLTRLEDWRLRDPQGRYAAKRLRDSTRLTGKALEKMFEEAKKHQGKDYDLAFGWEDDRQYCSELVWKIYRRGTGIELCPTRKLKDFDLSNPKVTAKLKERYGATIPLEETVVSPQDLWDSKLLTTVREYQ